MSEFYLAAMNNKKLNYFLSLSLGTLILVSTIGINLATSFCSGCQVQKTFILTESGPHHADFCCHNQGSNSCCSSEEKCEKENHKTTSHYFQVRFDLTHLGFKVNPIAFPISLFLNPVYFIAEATTFIFSFEFIDHFSPPPSGRALLALICILRN